MVHMDDIVDMIERHRDFADFVFIYIHESHPTDGWVFNDIIKIKQHASLEERLDAARHLKERIPCPIYVDSMENEAMWSYAALPDRLVIVNNHIVEFIGKAGPFGFNTAAVCEWIDRHRD
ncbi:unnamed protein product [Owenia fusiformis]|uniref:Iodothyronine deiodinase n=1 Tax=Owenia fusiformis TaxID=6347 RepID=A0A8J1XYY1_OWEFU|nr:unnamed protein product [Owenia fusiformis]